MNWLSVLGAFVGSMGWYIIPFVVILSVVVFFHELGHYLIGRWCGVKVDAFSLGFGPELFAWVDKSGTRWRLAAFPLGGYVKFRGDANVTSAPDMAALAAIPRSERGETLAGQPVLKRAAIVAAGPFANFLLAIVIFTVSFAFGQYHLARIGRVEVDSPAASAGFQEGRSDQIGQRLCDRQFRRAAGSDADEHRSADGFASTASAAKSVDLTATPTIAVVDPGVSASAASVGLALHRRRSDRRRFEPCGLPNCAAGARPWNGSSSRRRAYIVGMFDGRESADQISGLIGVAQMAGEMAKISLWELFSLAAWFSVSVGLMNLLPVPMLDGGHLRSTPLKRCAGVR